MKTTVVNIKNEDYDIYIGRIKSTYMHYGNPFIMGRDGTRKEVIEKHWDWLKGIRFTNFEQKQRKWILKNLYRLYGKRIGCHCKPLDCHGDNYIKLMEGMK